VVGVLSAGSKWSAINWLISSTHARASGPAVTEVDLCCSDGRILHNQLPSVSRKLWSILPVIKLVENEV
jgi:hypothetical protein